MRKALQKIRTGSWILLLIMMLCPVLLSAQNVRFTGEQVTLKAAMKEISKQTKMSVDYNTDKINANTVVDISHASGSLEHALATILTGTGYTYEIRNNHILLKVAEKGAQTAARSAGKVTVQGEVLDPDGEPAIGATVTQVGTANAVVTDIDGRFTIETSPNAMLRVTYIGYEPQEVTLKRASRIVLKESVKELDEVVVIGYTQQKKGLLTGAVENLKVDQALASVPTTAAGSLLAGKLAGVNVATASGIPGSDPTISIRTNSSWNTQGITYVIDGVVRGSGDFNALSPNEIEDISVLKDAASAAIYGSRSAGGVIIVTTKKGQLGKPVFNYSYSYAVDSRTKNSELTDAVETGELFNRMNGLSSFWSWSDEELDYIRGINGGYGYDQLDIVWKNPTTQTHNFSVNGGSERIRYFAAASYVRQTGFLQPLKYDKYNVRMNVTADVTNNLELYTGFGLFNDFIGNATFEGPAQTYSKLRIWQPDQPVYTDGGQYMSYGWIANVGANVEGASGYNKSEWLKPQLTVSATYKVPFLKGLSAKVLYARSWSNTIDRQYYTNYDMMETKKSGVNSHIISTSDADIIGTRRSTWVGKEYLQKKSSWSGDKQFNVQLNYNNTFNGVHSVSAALVSEWYEGNGASVYGWRQTFPVYRTDQFWAASSDSDNTGGGGDTDWTSGRMSYIGQFNYTYDSKYLFNFSFREDGSMNFGPGHRWGFFPAGSIGWVPTAEQGFNFPAWVNNLKLRASVGLTGNDSVGGWQWQESYSQSSNAYFGTTPSRYVGLVYGNIVNPYLTWEKSLSWDFGVDFRFLDKFNMSADYWYRNTYDILGNRQVSLPTTFGLTMPAENYGEIHAYGFDFTLGYRGAAADFTWYANMNLSYGWNKTIKQDYAENAQYVDIPVGKTRSYISGYDFDCIIRTQEQLDKFNQEHPGYRNINGQKPELGMMMFKDLSGPDGKPDGIINSWDRVILKKRNFPVVTGLNIGGTWKGFSVDMTFSGNLGQKKWIYDLCEGVEWNRMWKPWYADSWTPENTDAWLPKRVTANSSNTYDQYTQFWLKDASFLRLKNMTVSYTLPKGKFYNHVFDNIRLYMSGSNLFVLSNFNKHYYDPEIGGGNAFPVMRQVSFGIDLKF